ncbi:hypothetical protein MBLNU459_g6933t1 [Dothideomycetes sp. NU459]
MATATPQSSSPSLLTPTTGSYDATPTASAIHAPPSPATATFQFPPHYSFPPFYTLQPNLTTLTRQLALWSTLIQSYCAAQRLFRLNVTSASSSPLFSNAAIHRQLDVLAIRRVLDYMCSGEGDRRAEWVGGAAANKGRGKELAAEQKSAAWIWWRRPDEWAEMIHAWVDGTGQKGSVLTVYELRESDAVQGQDWIGMDEDLLRRCLDVLVKRGKAQVFGDAEGAGVKFF